MPTRTSLALLASLFAATLLGLTACTDALPTASVTDDAARHQIDAEARRAELVVELDFPNQRLLVTDVETGETGPGAFRARMSVYGDGNASGSGALRTPDGTRQLRFMSGQVDCSTDGATILLEGRMHTSGAGWTGFTALAVPEPGPAEAPDCVIFDIVGSGVHVGFEAEGRLRWVNDPCGP